MKVYLGSDHRGFDLKEGIKSYLLSKGYDVEDCGNTVLDPADDYPDFVSKAAEKVAADQNSMGIVFGRSGAGECIMANKIKNIRAGVGFNPENVKLLRSHNNANVLSLGSQFVDLETAKNFVEIFLNSDFPNEERHVRRINKISVIENG